jgi:Holliday junction resolvase
LSNKKTGSNFEKELAKIFSDLGYWVMVIPDDKQGQPFDLIIAKDGRPCVIECKTCARKTFDISRIEVNQRYAFELFEKTGNHHSFFAFKYKDNAYLHTARRVLQAKENFDVTKSCPTVWEL